MKATFPWAVALSFACALGRADAAAPPASLAEIDVLVARLDDDHFAVRRRADEALRKLGKPALPVLRAHLANAKSVEVHQRLTAMIDDLTSEQRVAELVRQLGDQRSEPRNAADWHLRRYGKAVIPLLKKELTPTLDQDRRKHLERLIADLSTRR